MLNPSQKTLEEQFHGDDSTEFDARFWNRFVSEVAVRLRALDKIRIDWEVVSQQGIAVALDRINEVLLPAATRIREVAELGFLIARSTTERTLVEGQTITFIVDEETRELFTPGPFLALTRLSTPDDYAVTRLMFFDRTTGVLDLRIEAVFGDPGPHSDWQISAVAGAVNAQIQILASVQGVRDEVAGLKADTQAIKAATDAVKVATEGVRDQAIGARDVAVTARDQSLAARDQAEVWADADEDEPVDILPDRFSAKHWAEKAAQAASAVAASVAGGISFNPAPAGLDASTVQAAIEEVSAASSRGVLRKADMRTVAFTVTGPGSLSIKAGTVVGVGGKIFTFGMATPIEMPALTAGVDVAIWVRADGHPIATLDHAAPPAAGARLIGGAHYAPGGNAAGFNSGGNTTPQFNPFSLWDLKFRPACPDPRGMTLVAGGFWADIYLLNVNHIANGTSRFNQTIADGASPPRIPLAFGGNGANTYSSLTWWEAAEVMASHGKQLLDYAEFAAAAYGTTENQSAGTDPVSTILRQAYTSVWGIFLATGNMWIWGRHFGGGAAGAAWANTNGGRGQVFQQSNAVLFGGDWGSEAVSGSRASNWGNPPSVSVAGIGARGRSDHLIHD